MTKKKYYVYRLIDKDNNIIYVGRTQNLKQRFLQHEHLTDKVIKIEYIECDSDAEMAWKEIYYINLFYNELSENVTDVYTNGKMKDINLNDEWKSYNKNMKFCSSSEELITINDYNNYVINVPKMDYKNLIHIIEHDRLNKIGNDKHALSKKWFMDNQDKIVQLKNNTYNFFRNIMVSINKGHSSNNLWTTYPIYKEKLQQKGYTKGYINPNDNNSLTNKNCLAYLANNFYPTKIGEINEFTDDQYALTKMLHFIWCSDLKNGNEIWIYIPSKRMRNLLVKWIDNNSLEEN